MAPVASTSVLSGEPVPSNYIHSSGPSFRVNDGRTLLLRGINLSSSVKTPQGQPGWRLEGFYEGAEEGNMSWVGRILELEDADVHLERLREWGFNVLRLVFTWEAIEHQGPGKYDEAFLDYVIEILRKAGEHGFKVYMDPHQDLWSRFSGGSGAPYWTLLACGLDPRAFSDTCAALVECEWPPSWHPTSKSSQEDEGEEEEKPSEFPAMIWATNYFRLACLTVFTLFYAGRAYAPKCIIDGVNIQDWLEARYFGAVRALADKIHAAGDLEDTVVIGWDSLNEPNGGFLGMLDMREHSKESVLRVGPMPTGWQALRLGMGEAQEVENWRFGPLGPKRDGSIVVDPRGRKAWLSREREAEACAKYGWTRGEEWEVGTCVWALHGVWDAEKGECLQPDYFRWYRPQPGEAPLTPTTTGGGLLHRKQQARRAVEYGADYWLPHWVLFARLIREIHKEAILFVMTPVFQIPPDMHEEVKEAGGGRVVHSTHFYDGLTLVTKHWNWFNADALGILRGKYRSVIAGVKIGESAIRKCIREQLGMLRQDGLTKLGAYPTMMGEIGIPFDLDKKAAYSTGDYSAQTRALDASLNACDGANALNYTVWTYCPDNSHQWGDLWNGEDLSIWSVDDSDKQKIYRSASSHNLALMNLTNGSSRKVGNRLLSSSSRNSSRTSLLRRDSTASITPISQSSPNSSPKVIDNLSLAPLSALPPSGPRARRPMVIRQDSAATTMTATLDNDPMAPINLNDGARALPAFCRPYPQKTVGTATDIEFDIRSSVFNLEITVEHDDVQDPELPTEIFVPLVHYAEFPQRVSRRVRDQTSKAVRETDGDDDEVQEKADDDTLAEGNPTGSEDVPRRLKANAASRVEMALKEPSPAAEESSPTSTSRSLVLDVTVSAGRWEVDENNQLLKWYYPRPAPGAPALKHTIKVARKGGAIPSWVIEYGDRTPREGIKGFMHLVADTPDSDSRCVVS